MVSSEAREDVRGISKPQLNVNRSRNSVPNRLLSNELLPVALFGHELKPLVRWTSLVELGKRDFDHSQKAALDLILVIDLEKEDIVDRGNEQIKFLIPDGVRVIVDDGSLD